MLAIYINAGRTPSGNPKRGWIIVNDDGECIDFVDEGYVGISALRKKYPNTPSTGRLDVTKSTYNDAKKARN